MRGNGGDEETGAPTDDSCSVDACAKEAAARTF